MAKRNLVGRAKGVLNRVFNFELLGQPVGKAVIWSAGFGLSRGLGALVAKVLPLEKQKFGGDVELGVKSEMLLSQLAVAFVVRMKPVQRMIGEKTSSIIAISAWLDAVNTLLPIGDVIEGWLDPARKGILASIRKAIAGEDPTAGFGPFAAILKPIRRALGLEGLGDIDTMIPVASDYDVEMSGFGADEDLMLTAVEDKMANIAG
ncbi:MAG: hypothetical protein AMS21_00815 [Gemmatimonas sp. SG8_38_2]|nr:MAG: hypothetical protein AMS21_00815 [Gemmatimonas sp. SG8_38_2]